MRKTATSLAALLASTAAHATVYNLNLPLTVSFGTHYGWPDVIGVNNFTPITLLPGDSISAIGRYQTPVDASAWSKRTINIYASFDIAATSNCNTPPWNECVVNFNAQQQDSDFPLLNAVTLAGSVNTWFGVDTGQYTFVGPQGASITIDGFSTTVVAAPEMPTWTMFMIGFATLATFSWRKVKC